MSISIKDKITSRKNAAIIEAAGLSERKNREAAGAFAIEGIKLFSEAVSAGANIRRVFVTESALERYESEISKTDSDIYLVTNEVYDKLTFENAPQGIFAVVDFFSPEGEERDDPFVLLLDEVGDPGNLGTIIRCADAFGVECVYIGSNGVDLYNPKTVRACMGSLFRVKTERCDAKMKARELSDRGYVMHAAMLSDDARDIRDADLSGKVGIVIGNEGRGISSGVASECEKKIIIPMTCGIQSLNAAVAASLLMWEAARSRLK